MRIGPHHHPCQRCGAKTECEGLLLRNDDGFPEVICDKFHLDGGEVNADFLCDECAPFDPSDDPDGPWGGGFAPNH